MVRTGLKGVPMVAKPCGNILGIEGGPCGCACIPFGENPSKPADHDGFGGAAPIKVPLTKSKPVPGEGELLKNAEGEDSWLVTMADKGEASLDPAVVSPFIDCVTECCCNCQHLHCWMCKATY